MSYEQISQSKEFRARSSEQISQSKKFFEQGAQSMDLLISYNTRLKAASRLLLPSVDTEQTKYSRLSQTHIICLSQTHRLHIGGGHK